VHERRASISAKDARDEGMRLRQSISQPDDDEDDNNDDDDDDDGGQVLNAVTVATLPHIVVQVNYSSAVVAPVHHTCHGLICTGNSRVINGDG